MQEPTNSSSRKKFLWWGAAALASLSVINFRGSKKKGKVEKEETVKMLTQDGRLVEIDKKLLASGSKKISTDELKQWVNKGSAK